MCARGGGWGRGSEVSCQCTPCVVHAHLSLVELVLKCLVSRVGASSGED